MFLLELVGHTHVIVSLLEQMLIVIHLFKYLNWYKEELHMCKHVNLPKYGLCTCTYINIK